MTEILQYDDSPRDFVNPEGDVLSLSDIVDDESDYAPEESAHDDRESDTLPLYELKEKLTIYRPDTVAAHKRRIASNDFARTVFEDRHPTSYEQLGGGLYGYAVQERQHERPLDGIIRGSEPRQTEVYDAVERFGLNELSVAEYDAMSKSERIPYTLYCKRFFDHIGASRNLIELMEGKVEFNQRLDSQYGSDRTPQELLDYSERLEKLSRALATSDIGLRIQNEFVSMRRTMIQVNKCKSFDNKQSKRRHTDYQLTYKFDSSSRKTYHREA